MKKYYYSDFKFDSHYVPKYAKLLDIPKNYEKNDIGRNLRIFTEEEFNKIQSAYDNRPATGRPKGRATICIQCDGDIDRDESPTYTGRFCISCFRKNDLAKGKAKWEKQKEKKEKKLEYKKFFKEYGSGM